MNIRLLVTTFVTLLLPLHAPSASALTMKQFSDICHSSPEECSDYPSFKPMLAVRWTYWPR